MMRRVAFLAALLAALTPAAALAQGVPAYQIGTVLPGHPAAFAENGQIVDAGSWPAIIGGMTPASTYGFVASTLIDNATAMSTLFADASSPTVFFPAGTYRIGCGHAFNAASALSLVGAGKGVTIIQLDPGCALANPPGNGLFQWSGKPGAAVRNLTLDLNGATAVANQNILFFTGATFDVSGVEVKGAIAPHMLLVVGSATTGTTIADYHIQNNTLSFPAGSTTQNQCIATTTNALAGTIDRGIVTGNICVNSGMQIDGDHNVIANNDISGWNFGTGIFAPPTGTDTFDLIADNNLHDSGLAHDSNAVAAGGIESDGNKNVIIGNSCTNLGGACLVNFGQYATITGNSALDVGKVTSPTVCENAGFETPVSGANSYGANSIYTGNFAANTGANTAMKFGYCEPTGGVLATGIKFYNNDFRGATSAYSFDDGNNSLIDWTLLARQKHATNIASIDFAGLDTASYHYWKLECNGVGPVAAAAMQLRVGEGAGPTYQSAASYSYTGAKSVVGGGGITQFNSTTGTGILLGDNQWNQSTMNTLTVEFGDLGAVDTKSFSFEARGIANGSGLQDVRGSGVWGADNNPITAVRLMAVGQNITVNNGCLLWGHP